MFVCVRQRQERVGYKGVECLELHCLFLLQCVGCVLVISVVSCVKTTL